MFDVSRLMYQYLDPTFHRKDQDSECDLGPAYQNQKTGMPCIFFKVGKIGHFGRSLSL
jgi:hypothetical protein